MGLIDSIKNLFFGPKIYKGKDYELLWNVARIDGPPYDMSQVKKIQTNRVCIVTDWVGKWPEIKNAGSRINGGIPQAGNLKLSFEDYENLINYWCPVADFTGWIVLDFEKWFPQWDRLYDESPGIPSRYKTASIEYAYGNEKLAKKQWEASGIDWFLQILKYVRTLRPKAKIAYFDLMQRSYFTPYHTAEGDGLRALNDKLAAIHAASDAILVDVYQFYPSYLNGAALPKGAIYGGNNLYSPRPPAVGEGWYTENKNYVMGNIKEGLRLARLAGDKPVYSYTWHRYHDSSAFAFKLNRSVDLDLQMIYPQSLGAKGSFIWGNESAGVEQYGGAMQPYIDSTFAKAIAKLV